jgi:hypothetical protein
MTQSSTLPKALVEHLKIGSTAGSGKNSAISTELIGDHAADGCDDGKIDPFRFLVQHGAPLAF